MNAKTTTATNYEKADQTFKAAAASYELAQEISYAQRNLAESTRQVAYLTHKLENYPLATTRRAEVLVERGAAAQKAADLAGFIVRKTATLAAAAETAAAATTVAYAVYNSELAAYAAADVADHKEFIGYRD